jgi:putative restriction endonuclease
MKGFIAVTHKTWYEFLAARQPLDEVNFWQPRGATPIRNLDVGEPFLFKLHAPDNFIVGIGYYTAFSALPVSLAWEAFKEKNGAASLTEMRHRLESLRGRDASSPQDYTIGCVVLTAPCFFPRDGWIALPPDYPLHAVRGKTYDLTTGEGLRVWLTAASTAQRTCNGTSSILAHDTAVGFAHAEVFRRLGQGGFRVLVTDAYHRQCSITRERALPVLEAAHIKPVAVGGSHAIGNGLLLRSDIHTLFDRGYITVTPTYRVEISPRLRSDFDNGRSYYRLAGSEILLPRSESHRPTRASLEWHADDVFLR